MTTRSIPCLYGGDQRSSHRGCRPGHRHERVLASHQGTFSSLLVNAVISLSMPDHLGVLASVSHLRPEICPS
jgi:hypothetical protein